MVRQDDFKSSLMILEVWRQGKDFGSGGQACLMIAGCLSNRARLGWGQLLDVLKAAPKFSATLELPNRDAYPDIWDPAFIKLLHAIPGIVDGSIPDPSMGGLYWADLSKGRPGITNPWFSEKILGSPIHAACCNINSFTVFR